MHVGMFAFNRTVTPLIDMLGDRFVQGSGIFFMVVVPLVADQLANDASASSPFNVAKAVLPC